MADRLTQLQDCLDEINTLMYATLNYIQTRHPYGEIPGQPSQGPDPAPLANGDASQSAANQPEDRPGTPPPEHPEAFKAALHELAQGLVLKEQQMEILINSLPGLGASESDQERRMQELAAELQEVEKERAVAEEEKEQMVETLGALVVKVGRIP
ncbi:hypothetical protein R9X50_00015800 [Acrodontium crateriforme]|uniref:Mediator of RNA polymerase II transcription subunit 21 n=1 Tax=Acrodontium crateriforme TaxID=150365 RepID=A0AAQ3LWT7_9PEZI|nr:hypothetical protein R9X50_00015800 [Acrodontium crateriforme]